MAFAAEFWRGVPEVPKFKAINAGANQLQTIQQNINALPLAQQLATQYNSFSQDQLQAMYEKAIPGFSRIAGNIAGNIEAMSRGDLNVGDIAQLQRGAAQRSLAGGYGGTGMGRNLEARDIGATQFGVMQQAQDSLTKWMQANQAPQFDVGSMFRTAQQGFEGAQSERDSRFQRDYVANINKAKDSFGSRASALEDTNASL